MLPADGRVLREIARKRKRVLRRAKKFPWALLKVRKKVKRGLYRQWNKRYRLTYVTRLDRVPSREELPALLNARSLNGVGVEVGVKRGRYSQFVLTRWRCRKLISIDPWLEDESEAYVDKANVAQTEHERFFEETRQTLAPFGARSEIWRLTSTEAAERVPDEFLDLVYIDARHDYESVLEDLAAWFSKVRPGGILAGHDYATGRFPQGDFGVKKAVDEFFAARGIRVYATQGRPPAELFASWLVEIPPSRVPKNQAPGNAIVSAGQASGRSAACYPWLRRAKTIISR